MSIDGKITLRQMAWLIITIRVAVVITAVASIEARQDAWIAEMGAVLIKIFMALIIVLLALRFPSKSIFQYPQLIFGKLIGTGIVLGYLWFFLFVTASLTRELGDFITTVFMPQTPIIVVIGMFVLACAYAVHMGIESITRINDIFVPILMLSFGIFFLLVWQDADLSRLRPVFVETGALQIIKSSIVASAGFMLVAAFGVLLPHVNEAKRAFPFMLAGLAVVGFMITTSVITYITVLGVDQFVMVNFEGLAVTRVIAVADFFERLDPLTMLVWVVASFIKVAVFYYCFVLGIGQLLKTEEVNLLVVPTGAAVIALSLISFESFPQLENFFLNGWVVHNHIFLLFIPASMLTTAIIFNKKEQK